MYHKPRIFIPLLLLLILLLPAISISLDWLEFPKYAWLDANLHILPYVVFAVGLVLCYLSYNSRECNLFIVLVVSFAVLSQFFWSEGLAGFQKELLFNVLCVVIPLNFLIFYYRKECPFKRHGIKYLLFFVVQIITVFWLVKTNPLGISTYISMNLRIHPWQGKTIIKQSGLVVISFSILTLYIHWLLRPNKRCGAWILALISVVMALHFVFNTQLATVYFIIAGLLLIGAIIIDLYYSPRQN